VSFPPATGREIQKTRPAVVVSNDTSNALINRVQVVPISNQVARIYSAECLVSVGEQPRKAMADQVITISKDRLMRLVSQLTKDDMEAVARAVRIQLGL
jgi:mRNA interferase MazF